MRLILFFLFACAAFAQRSAEDRLLQYPSRGLQGAVAGGTDAAVNAGLLILQQGGNAVDAGVAAMFAAAVVEYSHFGFGGEAPILIRTPAGQVVVIAGIGPMPALASADFFRRRRLKPGEILSLEEGGLKDMVPAAGILPAVVPGMVEAALIALRHFGTRPFADVIRPAIQLADGAPVDETRARSLARARKYLAQWPDSARVFLPGGRVPRAGEILRQPDLARTLRAMVDAEQQARNSGKGRAAAIDAVRDYFYRGPVARAIDQFSRANDGLLRYDDFASFRLQPEAPISVHYRGFEIHKPGFWSQGPVMAQILNLLDGFDRSVWKPTSPQYLHTLAEVMKLAYADRDTYYGDPSVVAVPSDILLSKEYAATRRKLITPEASLLFRPGAIAGFSALHPSRHAQARFPIDDALMARDTTCVNAIDARGFMFSATPSGAWLPSVIAGATGIPLTQRAQSFLLIPNHPNELAPRKRPRITLSPTLVTKDGKPFLALSTPGGDNQDQALTQLLLNVIEFNMGAQAAVEAPRIQTRHLVSSFDNHAMSPGVLEVDERFPKDVIDELAQRGHKIEIQSRWSSGAAPTLIRVSPTGVIEAAADPYSHRKAGAF